MMFRFEPQSLNSKSIKLRKKWGFRLFRKEHQKVGKTALLAQKVRKKYGFGHFLVLFLESAEALLSAHFHVFALQALWLESKYTELTAH